MIDVETGEPLRPAVIGHDGGGWSAAYSPDGSRLLTGAHDGSVSLWDARSGELMGSVVIPERSTATADFGADGRSATIVSRSRGVYVWNTDPDYAIEFACRLAGRDLTEDEWREHFADRPYQETCPAT